MSTTIAPSRPSKRNASLAAIAIGCIYILIATLAAGLGFTLYEKLGGSLDHPEAGTSPDGATAAIFGALLSYAGAALAIAGVGGILVGVSIVILAVFARRGVGLATYTLAALFVMSGIAKLWGAVSAHSGAFSLALWALVDFTVAIALVREKRAIDPRPRESGFAS